MPTSTGTIYVISGPSGVGKGTLCQALLEKCPQLRLSISATSRSQRPQEEHGIDYFFLTRTEFEKMIEQKALLEWAEYNGNYYGTPREDVERVLAHGNSILLEIDTQGALMVKSLFPKAFLIFIEPPSLKELERRLKNRGTNDDDDIRRRMAITQKEMALKDRFDQVFQNEILEVTLAQLCQLVDSNQQAPEASSPS